MDTAADLGAVLDAMGDAMNDAVAESRIAQETGLDSTRLRDALTIAETRGLALVLDGTESAEPRWYLAHAGEWQRLVRDGVTLQMLPNPGPRGGPGEHLYSPGHGSFVYDHMETDDELGPVHVYEWITNEELHARFGFRDEGDGRGIVPFIDWVPDH